MTPKQLLKGYKNYTCIITQALAIEPVLLHKHPELQQATIVYDKASIEHWLSTHDFKCMNTRVQLTGDQRALVSVKEEMIAFVLSAADAFVKFSKEDKEKEEIKKAYEEISEFIETLTSEQITEGRVLLLNLEKDERVSIPMDGIGRLINFGIEADYNKQVTYEKTQPKPVQASSKPLNNNNAQPDAEDSDYSDAEDSDFDAEDRELSLAMSESRIVYNRPNNNAQAEAEDMALAIAMSLGTLNNQRYGSQGMGAGASGNYQQSASYGNNINNNYSSSSSSSSMYQHNGQQYASRPLMYSFPIVQQRTEAENKNAAEAELERARINEYKFGSYKMGFGAMLKMKIPKDIRSQISHFEFWHRGKKMNAWPTATPAFFSEVEITGLNLTHLLDNPETELNIHRASIKLINMTGGVLKECPVYLYRDLKNTSTYVNGSLSSSATSYRRY